MARQLTVFLLSAACLTTGCGTRIKDADVAETWLVSSCTVTGRADLIKEVQRRGEALEVIFLAAFQAGPSGAKREALAQSVERQWSMLQVQIAEADEYGLSADEVAEMKAITLGSEKSAALERLDFNYRAAALAGIGLTRGTAGQQLLSRIAGDSRSSFRTIAAAALKRPKPD
jgi:hypothetical protein